MKDQVLTNTDQQCVSLTFRLLSANKVDFCIL